MKPGHLSEDEIQQYALAEADPEPGMVEHIQTCENCRARVANYKLLFGGIELQPKPIFYFDIATLVLSQLPKPRETFSWSKFFVYGMVCIVSASIAVPLYLFRELFINMADGISTSSLYAMSATALVIILYRVIEMFKKYQKQIRTLDFN